MQAFEAIEVLSHLSPNTPENGSRPFSDKRFSQMWCPFHRRRQVGMLVYQDDWGGVVFTCSEGCRPQQCIYAELEARHLRREWPRRVVIVTRLSTSRGSHWQPAWMCSQKLREW